MTPRQFALLRDRRREEMVQRELIAAYTTTAVINFAANPPKEGVRPLDFMPSHPKTTAFGKSDAQLEAESNALIESLRAAANAAGGKTTWTLTS